MGRCYLIVADVIITFVDAAAIWTIFQRICDILDIGDPVHDRADRPMGIAASNLIIVN